MRALCLVLLVGLTAAQNDQIDPEAQLDDAVFYEQLEQLKVPISDDSEAIKPMAQISEWPQPDSEYAKIVGQVAGVAIDSRGLLHVFHRGARIWQADSFDEQEKFTSTEPIAEPTHLVVNTATGQVVEATGANRFFMPHGLTIDADDNCWLTDVAMHQVFKIPHGQEEPSLTLGVKMEPGDDDTHFCKPTDVAVASNGNFFVADGYCNSRIMKFTRDGTLIASFGKMVNPAIQPPPVDSFAVPHSLTLVEDWNMICVADRENQRIECFTAGLPTTDIKRSLPFGVPLKSALNLGRVYAIRSVDHDIYGITNMAALNGDSSLFKVNLETGDSHTLTPGFDDPHALAIDENGSIYIGEIGTKHVLKVE